nr:NAD(P)/FAD-dependent oxidoreductase [bacterium]
MTGKTDTKDRYDIAIIGAGPAGLAASVYASRYKLSNIVIGPELGGYVSTTHLVEDYLGFESVSGMDLATSFGDHAKTYDEAAFLPEKVTGVSRDGDLFHLKGWAGAELSARAVLFGTGSVHNNLGVPGEKVFEGKGVS